MWWTVALILAGEARGGPPSAGPSEAEEVAAIRAAVADGTLLQARLAHLCDRIGPRLAGSPGLEEAVAWAAGEMAGDGFDAVWTEEVAVRRWVRGHERVWVEAPYPRDLHVLTLGGSVGTEGVVRGEVVVVDGFDHLDALGAAVAGKVVLFDVPFSTYGQTVVHRTRGPARAAAHGAIAALVRSITPVSLDTPHTGATVYDEGGPRIPAVAVTVEDAAWMRRLDDAGETIRVSLDLGARDEGPALSHNVVAERRGTDLADEIVLLGCHLDAWDVGQGAQDDAAGCLAVWEAGRILAALPRPRRTLRIVLYTNEENGLAGARAYAAAHGGEVHVAAIESDTGAGPARGFRIAVLDADGGDDEARLGRILEDLDAVRPRLDGVGAGRVVPGYAGADIGPLVAAGAVGFGVDHDTTGYWPVHHTRADTLDKIAPEAMRHNVQAIALLAHWLLATDAPLVEWRRDGAPSGASDRPSP